MAVLYMFFLATACPPDLKIFHVHVRAARGQVTPRQLSARSALLLVVLVAWAAATSRVAAAAHIA